MVGVFKVSHSCHLWKFGKEYYSVLNEPFLSEFQTGEKREKTLLAIKRVVQCTTNYSLALAIHSNKARFANSPQI